MTVLDAYSDLCRGLNEQERERVVTRIEEAEAACQAASDALVAADLNIRAATMRGLRITSRQDAVDVASLGAHAAQGVRYALSDIFPGEEWPLEKALEACDLARAKCWLVWWALQPEGERI